MQDDVNGVSWLFADLLAALGVWFYTAAVNPIRGARPKPFPGAFWWEGPSGKKVLAWNGYHYLFGRNQAGLGNFDLVDRMLPRWVEQLEADQQLPLRLPLLRIDPSGPGRQRPARPAHARLRRALERRGPARTGWPSSPPPSSAGMLKAGHGNAIGTQRGDWTDHWTDGPGSSAYETGVNRATHEILAMAEAIEAWLRAQGRAALGRGARRRHLRERHALSTSTPGAPIPRSRRRTRCSRGRNGTGNRASPTRRRWRRTTSSPAPPTRSPRRSARRGRRASSTSATSTRRRRSSRPASTRCW